MFPIYMFPILYYTLRTLCNGCFVVLMLLFVVGWTRGCLYAKEGGCGVVYGCVLECTSKRVVL